MASARGMCSAVNRSRKSSRTDRRPTSTPAATARTPARTRSSRPHPVRSKTAVTSVSCRCSDCAVSFGASCRQKPGGAQAEGQVQQASPRGHRTLPPPADRVPRVCRPEHGLDELGERVRAEPGDEQDQRDTSPGRLGTACTAPALLAGAPAAPVRSEREAQGKVADEKVDRAAADQAEPGHRAQPHTGRAPRQRQCSSVQRRSGGPAWPMGCSSTDSPR